MFMLLTEMGTEYKYSGIYLITNIVNNMFLISNELWKHISNIA